MGSHRTTLLRRIRGGLVLVVATLLPSLARADEPSPERLAILSVSPHFSLGGLAYNAGTTARLGSVVGFRVGTELSRHFGVAADFSLLAGFGTSYPDAIDGADSRPPTSVAVPHVSLLGSWRPVSLVELSVGPTLGAFRGPMAGGAARLSLLLPVRRIRIGPGAEVTAIAGDALRVVSLTAVITVVFPILERQAQ